MNLKEKNLHSVSIGALFISAIFWASAVVVLKNSLDRLSPVWILAMRFMLAGILLLMVLAPKCRQITKETLKSGIWMGIILYFEFWFFTVGLKETTSSKATFALASYIVILPFLYWIVRRKRPKKCEIAASFLCLGGLGIILLGSLDGINHGDLLILCSAACYALHIIYTGIFAKKSDPALLNLVQIGTGGIIGLIIALIGEPVPAGISGSELFHVSYLAVGCTILPYMLSVFGQKHVKTSTSGIILSFESVFGCIFSVLFLGDKINLRFILGAAIVMSSFFLVEYGNSNNKVNKSPSAPSIPHS